MFHNVLMTSLTPLRDTNEITCWDNRPFTTIWPEVKQEKIKETGIKKTIKKKNKRNRTMFTTEQVRALENVFSKTKYIDTDRRREIAECLQIEQKCIKIWFQNRRMKEKKDLSESSETASEGNAASFSPPLESAQPANNITNDSYLHSSEQCYIKSQQQYHYAPHNYFPPAAAQNQPSTYDPSNYTALPQYINYNNYFHHDSNTLTGNTNYTSQFCSRQNDFKYYYNPGAAHNQLLSFDANFQDWPVNIFDTSYL